MRRILLLAMLLAVPVAKAQSPSGQDGARSPFPGQGFRVAMLDYVLDASAMRPVQAPGQRQALREALRRGGLAIVCRHGATDWLAPDIGDDASVAARADRVRQRNLRPLGAAEAGAIRDAFDHLQLRPARVYASFYYRTREFAMLATGQEPAIRDELLPLSRPDISTWFDFVVGAAAEPGLAFISAHGQPLGAAGISVGEGDCVILRADGPKRMVALARLRPSDLRPLLIP
jgi:hypothetical protein